MVVMMVPMPEPVADDPTAFPTLDADDIALLDALGTRRRIEPGEYLYRAGDLAYDFHVLLSGAVDIIIETDGEERLIARHIAGRFLGELNMLTGLRVFVSARVVEAGEVIVVPVDELRRVLATRPALSDLILAAFIARRGILMSGAASSLRVIGSRFSPESTAIREFLERGSIPHEWLDADNDAAVEGTLEHLGIAADELPVVIVSGNVLRRPTAGALAQYLGLTVDTVPARCFDLVIIGGGPAGLAAAVYGASEGLDTLGLEQTAVGGQAGASSRIENYLGFPLGISGLELTQRALVQAEKFGAHLTAPCAAVSLRDHAGHLIVRLQDGTEVAGRAVIAASGARYRRLDADRLDEFEPTSVYYSATESELRDCRGAPVVVVGGGNSAGQAVMFLSQACPVTLVIRGNDLGKSMSRYLVDRIEADERIAVRRNTRIVALEGDVRLDSIRMASPDGDATVPASALFSFIGADPNSDWLSSCAALDDDGFVLTDRMLTDDVLGEPWRVLGRRPLPYETSHPGLFAVGDLRSGSTKRVATAVGEGSAAVRAVHEYLAFSR
jgi:thioredoxin reductase (NADPH)